MATLTSYKGGEGLFQDFNSGCNLSRNLSPSQLTEAPSEFFLLCASNFPDKINAWIDHIRGATVDTRDNCITEESKYILVRKIRRTARLFMEEPPEFATTNTTAFAALLMQLLQRLNNGESFLDNADRLVIPWSDDNDYGWQPTKYLIPFTNDVVTQMTKAYLYATRILVKVRRPEDLFKQDKGGLNPSSSRVDEIRTYHHKITNKTICNNEVSVKIVPMFNCTRRSFEAYDFAASLSQSKIDVVAEPLSQCVVDVLRNAMHNALGDKIYEEPFGGSLVLDRIYATDSGNDSGNDEEQRRAQQVLVVPSTVASRMNSVKIGLSIKDLFQLPKEHVMSPP